MAKLFSFSRAQAIIILTMSFMLILGAAYIFIYIPNHKRRVEELRFRCLQNVQTNIKAKRDNSVALLKTLLVKYMKDSSDNNKSLLKSYIAFYPTDNFTLTQPERKASKPAYTTRKIQPNPFRNIDLNYPDNVAITLTNDQLNIFLHKGRDSIGMKYTPAQFFGTLLPLDTFDQYLVIRESNIIYQTFESGITKIQADSLPTQNGAFSKEQVKNVVIGGAQYKLFAQQLNLDEGSVLTVAGLLKNQTYQDEKNELPGNVVIFLMIISIATILILPWIKLYQIGGKDRLTAADGMLTFPIAMLFISILFFTSFKYNFGFGQARITSEASKKNLAVVLERTFMSNVTRAYNDLRKLDALFHKRRYNVRLTGKDTLLGLGKIKEAFREKNIDRAFWLDSTGQEMGSWTSFDKNAPEGNFSNREYFRNIKDNKSFFLQNDKRFEMYLEPVISWVSGKFVSAIATTSGKSGIAAVSFNLEATDRSILPTGLSYCIINESGKVLYHSNALRNLNEDLFSELTGPEALKSSILAKTSVFFESGYRGRRYDVFAKPFKNFPYLILIFEDTEMKVNRDMNVSYFCFFMLLSLFLIIIVELLLVFLLSYQGSYFKKHYFDISWVGPDDRFRNQYLLSTGWNILNIGLLCVLYYEIHFLEFLAILLVSVTTIVLFLNEQYRSFYEIKKADTAILKARVSRVLIGIIIFITIAASFLLPQIPFVLVAYVAVLAVIKRFAKLFKPGRKWIFKKLVKSWPSENLSKSFSVMVFSALIVTSGIPVAVLFLVSNAQELKLFARYRHKQFADEIVRQHPAIINGSEPTAIGSKRIEVSNAFSDGIWIKDVQIVTDSLFRAERARYAGKAGLDTLYYQLIPYHADVTPDLSGFNCTTSAGYTYYCIDGVNITYSRLRSGKYLRLRSASLRYENPLNILNDFKKGTISWLVFILTLFSFWAVLHQILRKLFALDFPAQAHWEKVDKVIFSNPELNSLLFILGAPGTGKMKILRNMIENGRICRRLKNGKCVTIQKTEYDELDLLLIPDNFDPNNPDKAWTDTVDKLLKSIQPLIVVNHFEYDIKNPATNHYKLDLLEKLLQRKDRKVMIVSTVHPMHFLDSFNNQLKPGQTFESMTQSDRERWHVVLGHFRIIIYPLAVGRFKDEKQYPKGMRILAEETNRAHFLVKMQRPIIARFNKIPTLTNAAGSGLAMKIGISAHYFYTYIWQSLTKEEKFLLYDLAEDGLVNPYDDYNITILISKGLIVRKHGLLKLFNEGFRTFILTAIASSEVALIRDQIKDSGNWRKLKTPLIVIAVAVLVFLYASQNEAYSEIIKYVGVITVAVPAVYKIFGALENIFPTRASPSDKNAA